MIGLLEFTQIFQLFIILYVCVNSRDFFSYRNFLSVGQKGPKYPNQHIIIIFINRIAVNYLLLFIALRYQQYIPINQML